MPWWPCHLHGPQLPTARALQKPLGTGPVAAPEKGRDPLSCMFCSLYPRTDSTKARSVRPLRPAEAVCFSMLSLPSHRRYICCQIEILKLRLFGIVM